MQIHRFLLSSFVCTVLVLLSFTANAAMVLGPGSSKRIESPISSRQYLKASVFVNLSRNEFEVIRGKKLSFMERMYFKSAQKKLRRELKNDNNLLITKYYDEAKGKFKIDGVWFVIGFLIGPVGILFSYITHQSLNNRKSAILGTVIWLIWFGYLFLF